MHAMPSGTAPKLARVKMGKMIRKGVVDGCACGCRGDFALNAKSRAILEDAQ